MAKRRLIINEKKLRELLKDYGRRGSKKDFFELLKRAVMTSAPDS